MNNLLIIPCFNDNQHLKMLLDSPIFKKKYLDILIIDDGSDEEVIKEIADFDIKLIRNELNRGKGYALRQGLDYAFRNSYSHAITLDADLQHDPKHIDDFINIDPSINIVIGARRFDKSMPMHRRFSNSITSFIVSSITGKKILDSQSGYRRYSLTNETFRDCTEDGFPFESEILINEMRLKEAKVEHIYISTIYNTEKSSINNTLDTYKFIKLIIRKIIGR